VVCVAARDFSPKWRRDYALSTKLSYLVTALVPQVPVGDPQAVTRDAIRQEPRLGLLQEVLRMYRGWQLQLVPGSSGDISLPELPEPARAEECLDDLEELRRFLFLPTSYLQLFDPTRAPPRMMPSDRENELTYLEIHAEPAKTDQMIWISVSSRTDLVRFENGFRLPLSHPSSGWDASFLELLERSIVCDAEPLELSDHTSARVTAQASPASADITEAYLDYLTDYPKPWRCLSRLHLTSDEPEIPQIGSDIVETRLRIAIDPEVLGRIVLTSRGSRREDPRPPFD
jgi:hypothetical protein